jgi:DNA polymerase-3 subunit beta
VLSAIGSEEIELAVSGELDPAVIRPATETTTSYLSVIMPMRI